MRTFPILGGKAPTGVLDHYSKHENALLLERQYGQDFIVPDNTVVSGLELWMAADSDLRLLTACCDGFISWRSDATAPASLTLRPSIGTARSFTNDQTVEPPPLRFEYFNVHALTLLDHLKALILNGYAAQVSLTSTHPAMRLVDRADPTKTLFQMFNTVDGSAAAREQRAAGIADLVINAGFRLPVKSGDVIGEAGPPWADTSRFSAPPVPGSAPANPRVSLFRIVEREHVGRDPRYDFGRWVAGPDPLVAERAINGKAHPLLTAIGFDAAGGYRPARPESPFSTNRRYISAKHLISTGQTYEGASRTWELKPDGKFRSRLSSVTAPSENCTDWDCHEPIEARRDKVSAIWANHQNDIVDMSWFFQVPTEILLAIIAQESNLNADVDSARFEAYNPTAWACYNKLGVESSDVRLTSLITAWTTTVNNVPATERGPTNSYNPNSVARQNGSAQLTWDDVDWLMENSPYFRARISPGLMQTLVRTAINVTDWAKSRFHDIRGAAGSSAVDWPTLYQVSDPEDPGQASNSRIQWLNNPRHSIFVGTAYLRTLYNGLPYLDECEIWSGDVPTDFGRDQQSHRWDLPRIGASYNAGKIKSGNSPWGMYYYGDYMTRFASFFNAAVELLNALPESGAGAFPRDLLRLG